MNSATRTLVTLALLLGLSSAARAQDSKPSKGKQAEKAAKKSPPPAPSQDVTYLDLSGPAEAESDLPTITKKGSL